MTLSQRGSVLLAACVLMAAIDLYADLKRSRTEDLVDVRASNTEGFSNIWVGLDLPVELRDSNAIFVEPRLCGRVGLASLLHLSGSTGIPKGRTLGTTEVHAQITLPGNDRLRFVGLGASGDMLLTIVANPGDLTPAFHPYLGFTLIADVDLIAKLPWLPLKFYANLTNLGAENIMLHFAPLSALGGMEYKGSRHSLFAGGQIMLLKQNQILGQPPPSKKYDQVLFYVFPGLRYRFSDRISLVGRARLLLLSVGDSPLLPQRTIGVSVSADMPLLFKDTDSEALRSLIFMERKRKALHASTKANPAASQGRLGAFLPSDSLGDPQARQRSEDYFKQREELQKSRQKALDDMKKIEEMLE